MTDDLTPTWLWDPVSDAVLYEVLLNDVNKGTTTQNSFTSSEELQHDEIYTFSVRAKDEAGNWSEYKSARPVKVTLCTLNKAGVIINSLTDDKSFSEGFYESDGQTNADGSQRVFIRPISFPTNPNKYEIKLVDYIERSVRRTMVYRKTKIWVLQK